MSWNGVKKQSLKADVEAWCEEMGIEDYTINSQGEIDVDGGVFLNGKDFKELPYKFGTVTDYFKISYNSNLISLKNCPYHVGTSFDIDGCSQLSSLEGCPKKVDYNFWCRWCKRKFTSEEVRSLCKVMGYIHNDIHNQ